MVGKDFEEDNVFAVHSELGVAGRPLADERVMLPLSKDLVLPESLSEDKDLRFAERQRPSAEAVAAQKGKERWMMLLKSLLTMATTNYSLKGKPVIVVNLTSYVEDVGRAVSWLVLVFWVGKWFDARKDLAQSWLLKPCRGQQMNSLSKPMRSCLGMMNPRALKSEAPQAMHLRCFRHHTENWAGMKRILVQHCRPTGPYNQAKHLALPFGYSHHLQLRGLS